MQVVLTGASGLIGRALTEALVARGDEVIGVSRNPDRDGMLVRRWVGWDELSTAIDGANAVVHLAGAGIADKRWTAARKQELHDSRVETGNRVASAIAASAKPPATLVSASAVGYYGSGAEVVDEASPAGRGFLAELCADWERPPARVSSRTAILRFGVVLSAEGGALAKLLRPFRLGLGGPVGRGRQSMSWVHIDDAVGVILHTLDGDTQGAMNVCAPNPVTNREFSKILAATLGRPALFPVPPLMLKLMLGEGASVVTEGQRVDPRATVASGYEFRHPAIGPALASILRGSTEAEQPLPSAG